MNLAYEDFSLLFMDVDTHWTRQTSKPKESAFAFDIAKNQITELCEIYSNNISKNQDEYLHANKELGQVSPEEGARLDELLFNPLFYLPIGHSDIFCIVAVDDLDPIHYFASGITSSIEDLTISFCPKVDQEDFSRCKRLISPRQLIGALAPASSNSEDADLGQLSKNPYLINARLRTSALGTIGHGGLFHSALFVTIAKEIDSFLDSLRNHASCQQLDIHPDDIEQVRYCLLDMQGAEDIGILFSTNNLSLAASLLAYVEKLQFRNLFESGGRSSKLYQQRINVAESHNRLLEHTNTSLEEHSLFRWTQSKILLDMGNLEHCNGEINCRTELCYLPSYKGGTSKIITSRYSTPTTDAAQQQSEHDVFYFGLSHQESPVNPQMEDAQSALKRLDNLALDFSVAGETNGRHIAGMQSVISTPYIDSGLSDSSADLQDVFTALNLKLGTGPDALFSKRPLVQASKLIGIPLPLRRNIELLFQTFTEITSDPMYFDIVLDLYDTFVALYELLTHDLPARENNDDCFEPSSGDIDDSTVKQLAEIVESIDSALTMRLSKVFPESRKRDHSIEYRGSLTQIILGSDVPLKCGLGILRRIRYSEPEKPAPRGTVAGISALSFKPGARCVSYDFGINNRYICSIQISASHLLNPSRLLHNLHESFHIISHGLNAVNRTKIRTDDTNLYERLEEISALMLTQALVFAGNEQQFVAHHLTDYFRRIPSNKRNRVVLISEFIVRLFVATDSLRNFRFGENFGSEYWPTVNEDHLEVAERFNAFVNQYSHYLRDAENWEEGSEYRAYLISQFDWLFPRLRKHMDEIWQVSRLVCSKVCGCNFEKWSSLNTEVSKKIQNGEPFFRLGENPFLSDESLTLNGKEALDMRGVNPFYLLSAIYNSITTNFENSEGRRIYLKREPKNYSAPTYPADGLPWWPYQIDPGAPESFCPLPHYRSKRHLYQIATHKTLWDMASNFRSRRLNELLKYLD